MTLSLTDDGLRFLADRHLAILSTPSRTGGIHSVAVGFSFEDGIARVITSGDTQKVRNVERGLLATVAQVDGARWISLSGPAVVERDAESVERAVELYSRRYRTPGVNPKRVVIRIDVDTILASRGLRG
jgi:PPOX class probable F420-dependent enzyme